MNSNKASSSNYIHVPHHLYLVGIYLLSHYSLVRTNFSVSSLKARLILWLLSIFLCSSGLQFASWAEVTKYQFGECGFDFQSNRNIIWTWMLPVSRFGRTKCHVQNSVKFWSVESRKRRNSLMQCFRQQLYTFVLCLAATLFYKNNKYPNRC